MNPLQQIGVCALLLISSPIISVLWLWLHISTMYHSHKYKNLSYPERLLIWSRYMKSLIRSNTSMLRIVDIADYRVTVAGWKSRYIGTVETKGFDFSHSKRTTNTSWVIESKDLLLAANPTYGYIPYPIVTTLLNTEDDPAIHPLIVVNPAAALWLQTESVLLRGIVLAMCAHEQAHIKLNHGKNKQLEGSILNDVELEYAADAYAAKCGYKRELLIFFSAMYIDEYVDVLHSHLRDRISRLLSDITSDDISKYFRSLEMERHTTNRHMSSIFDQEDRAEIIDIDTVFIVNNINRLKPHLNQVLRSNITQP